MEKKREFFKVTIKGDVVEVEQLKCFKPHQRSFLDTELTKIGVVEVRSLGEKKCPVSYYLYEANKNLDWTGKDILASIAKINEKEA